MLPTSVEFQIHQVVPVFQISIVKNTCPNQVILRVGSTAKKRSGIQATKISQVKGKSGQAATSMKPERQLSNQRKEFFNVWLLMVEKNIPAEFTILDFHYFLL